MFCSVSVYLVSFAHMQYMNILLRDEYRKLCFITMYPSTFMNEILVLLIQRALWRSIYNILRIDFSRTTSIINWILSLGEGILLKSEVIHSRPPSTVYA